MRIAVIWQRFGPYHLARLKGTGTYFADVLGIEVAGRDHYAWTEVGESSEIDRRLLFPDCDYASLSGSEIRRAVRNELDRSQPDVVAINGWAVPEALAALHWCRGNGRRSVLMSETFVPSGSRFKEWIKRRRVGKYDVALVGGRWHVDYLVRLGFPVEKIRTGYDVVDNEYFSRGAEAARQDAAHWRRKLGLPTRYFFANTRFLPRKNIDGLLRAFAALGSEAKEWHVVISGSGEMEEAWRELGREMGLEDRLHWVGFVQYEQLPVYYGLAACFIHLAHSEAWGLVLNEACAAGLPIIAGNFVGASCELVDPGQNGFLVDSKSLGSITAILSRVISMSDETRREMGHSSELMVKRFSPAHFGETLKALVNLDTE